MFYSTAPASAPKSPVSFCQGITRYLLPEEMAALNTTYRITRRIPIGDASTLLHINTGTVSSGNLVDFVKERKDHPDITATLAPSYVNPAPDQDPVTGEPLNGNQPEVSSPVTFYLFDHLGNTRVTFRADAADAISITYAVDYYPYGKILREYNCNQNRYLSTHHERDVATGYDNRGARLYDSEIGRFLGVDPMDHIYEPWSPYHYVLGNPTDKTDPDGRVAQDCCGGPAMGYVREGFRRIFTAAGKLIDNAKLTVENAFRTPIAKETVGPTTLESYSETKASLSGSTNVSDLFSSGNWIKGGSRGDSYNGPPILDIQAKTTNTTVTKGTLAGKVEGLDVKLVLSRTTDNDTGQQKDGTKLQAGIGPADVFVKTDGNSVVLGAEVQNTSTVTMPEGKKAKAVQKIKFEYKIEFH